MEALSQTGKTKLGIMYFFTQTDKSTHIRRRKATSPAAKRISFPVKGLGLGNPTSILYYFKD